MVSLYEVRFIQCGVRVHFQYSVQSTSQDEVPYFVQKYRTPPGAFKYPYSKYIAPVSHMSISAPQLSE